MIRGAIFDFDGTLFDSMFVWDTAGEVYLRSIGRVPKENLQQVLKPLSLYQSASYCKREYDIPMSVQEIMDGVNKTVEHFYFHTVLPKPGIIAFLEQMQAHGLKMCIATATDRYMVEAALKRCGMKQFFSEILTCTDVGHGKDEPVIFQKAMEHLGTNRTDTIVVEDAYYAIQTAKKGGFLTAAVYDAHETKQEEIKAIVDYYLKDFGDFDLFWKFASEH